MECTDGCGMFGAYRHEISRIERKYSFMRTVCGIRELIFQRCYGQAGTVCFSWCEWTPCGNTDRQRDFRIGEPDIGEWESCGKFSCEKPRQAKRCFRHAALGAGGIENFPSRNRTF